MAKYDITYTCGHNESRQLYGKEADRQRYIAWAADHGTCGLCRAADKSQAIDEVEAEYGLPALLGSEKQIAWARKIRAEKIADAVKRIDQVRVKAESTGETEAFEAKAGVVMTALCGNASAKWWIDNRDRTGDSLLKAALA